MDTNTVYYAMMGSERVGPMSLEELRSLPLRPDTPVWHTGMADWADASTLPELSVCFSRQEPPYVPYNRPPQATYQPTTAPGYYESKADIPPRPDNYLVWSILVTVLCCLAGGIVALVYSSKVNACYDRGDYEGALRASSTTRTWCIISAILGCISGACSIFMFFFGALGNMLQGF